jgi:beta-glucanase (GH16 family)
MTLLKFFKKISIFAFLIFNVFLLLSEYVFCQHPPHLWKFEKTLDWSDEFNDNSKLDTTKWSYEVGGDGWGNNELQYYTFGENIKIENGVLKLIARKENKKKYTSTRIVTKNKAEWKYGRIEIKAKLPKGRGTWPAIWMLPENYFYGNGLNSGEIDIMEHVGFEPDVVHFSVHTKEYNSYLQNAKSKKITVKNVSENFHTYRMDWTPYGIRGYVDDKKYFEYSNKGEGYKYWPFDKKFFLILNLAIGGDWGGEDGVDNKIFPATFEIDYIRIYKFLE